ncbi:FkbM family methyltransferase [Arenimonas sp. MALMAid1274]|uniref:FkbM family methyltransferase n=1 Tax=Arenimonas sp. MALMAid1274 TaxID=3411630 RepID=UPI003BA162C7
MLNWLESIQDRSGFYARHGAAARRDRDFDWRWFHSRPSGRFIDARRHAKNLLFRLGLGKARPISVQWLRDNAEQLWSTRLMFSDDVSRLMFDEHLVLKVTDHRKHYFPRMDFEELLSVVAEEPFRDPALPSEYLGLPLMVFTVQPANGGMPVRVITTRLQLDLLNGFRQYLPHRNGVDLGPREGDVVIDCGACIGEVSLVFASMVGASGQVHLFDPVPLHGRFCQLQGQLNPSLAPLLHVNTLAVGDTVHNAVGARADSGHIEPGAIPIDQFSSTTIDDYCMRQGLDRLDFIKMDIEGSELAALNGGAQSIARFKPRLAISAYHKADDLWVLARRIKEINPGYRLSFGHHSPIQWESVLYADNP